MANGYAGFGVRNRRPGDARKLGPLAEGLQRRIDSARATLDEPFVGITTDGDPIPGLFPLQQTGVSTQTIRQAVETYLAALPEDQSAHATFPVDATEWRSWSNIHPFVMRHGVLIEELDDRRRELALGIVRASLSATGFETARDVMRLNDYIGEITGKWDEYGEWLYWMSIFGTPSADEPWGWQIDGHHLIVNCFVLGDQVVMTPMFMGSEPVSCEVGKHAGARVFQAEEAQGLDLVQALSPEQLRLARPGESVPFQSLTPAFCDNVLVPAGGIRHDELTGPQQAQLLELIETYIGRMRPDHARIRLDEIQRHLGETRFAWAGDTADDAVFYYRIQSPVVLIEFDHQAGIALDNDIPSRHHIHTIVRTPNGNDYGKDLLRQHHERFRHVNGQHVARS